MVDSLSAPTDDPCDGHSFRARILCLEQRRASSVESPIHDQSDHGKVFTDIFLDHYNATFSNAYGVPKAGVTFRWSYKLELVDKAGAPNPGVAGSGAAVDIGCTNNAVGIPHPVVSLLKSPANAYLVDFIWHHPDAANSEPPGRYHCNHLEEGPHGHQGLITLVVSDKTWECTATYKGTNSSLPFKKNENNLVNPNIRDGTASVPKCSRVR